MDQIPMNSEENITTYSECSEVSPFTEEMQEARSFLRERFLRCISGFVGSKCELHTLEHSTLIGEYNGLDIDGQDIFLKNLVTPMCNLKFALVRTSDLINMHLPSVKLKSNDDKEFNEFLN